MARRTASLVVLLSLSSGALAQSPRPAAPDAAPAAECDHLAASPYDAQAKAPGVEGDSIDHARAIPACEAAVAQRPESPRLTFQLGRAYSAAERDTDAMRLYRQSADKGYGPAMDNLGARYNEGRGVPIDKAEGVRWFRLAAEKGDARAMDDLGRAYESGDGVPQDDAEAARWFRRAAEKGYGPAMLALGVTYGDGRGVPKDQSEAERWYRKAVVWFRQAAERGSTSAMAQFGMLHENGGQGVPLDEKEAVRWYRLAADKGYATAMHRLGMAYADGVGVAQDHVESARWYRLAAEKGDAAGMFSLGGSYDAGEGVPKDPEEAARLILSALQRGDPRVNYAIKQIGELDLLLSPETCQALRRRVKDAGGTIGGPRDDDQCGPHMLRAIEALQALPATPR